MPQQAFITGSLKYINEKERELIKIFVENLILAEIRIRR